MPSGGEWKLAKLVTYHNEYDHDANDSHVILKLFLSAYHQYQT